MNIRFYHARILTMETDNAVSMKVLEDGELWVEKNRITYVGKERAQQREDGFWDRELDLHGNLILPGFCNAHTHSAMTFLRSYADDLPLKAWLNEQVFPMEARLSGDDALWLSKLAILEYLTSGVTSAFDMYLFPDLMAQAAVECGFRTVLVSGLNDFVSSVEELKEQYQRFNHYHELVGYRLGFHAEYTTGEERLKGVADLAHKYQAPVYAHISETASEVEECIGRHGLTPPVYLDSLGMFDYGGGGYHCVHMRPEDLDVFEKRNLSVITNPGSNVKLASGIAPVEEMVRRGINLAIGTDGPASNNCLDMFREMFLVSGLAKLRQQDAAAVPAEQVLYMAAKGGAKAMGLSDCGSLAPGKLADLTVIDLKQPNMQPVNDIVKNLVYSGSKQNVKLTMVNGRILYEDGMFFVGTEPEEIYRKANEIIGRMRKSSLQ